MEHSSQINEYVGHINSINLLDLQYIEKDLSYHEMVSLAFLLFGEDRVNAEFILQKLLILYQTPILEYPYDILLKYTQINSSNWRLTVIESLAIIGARRVLRKIGLNWHQIRTHFLPHISEFSLHINPILKVLFKICDRLTIAEASKLILHVNEENKSIVEHLRFYDFSHMELFLLHWMSKKIIDVGDSDMKNINLDSIIIYFKLNDMLELKSLLIETINYNTHKLAACEPVEKSIQSTIEIGTNCCNNQSIPTNQSVCTCILEPKDCYRIRKAYAGYILIINQRNFHQETNIQYKHLLSNKKLQERQGTDIDKSRLKKVFSQFGYIPEEYDNLNHIELLHRIREIVKRSECFDSLIISILSHGVDGIVYGCNSVPVNIKEIEEIITADSLQGKPKMLIIQACQTNDVVINKVVKKNTISVDKFVDIIKAMSIVPGYPSIRHTVKGTWFIQSLCDAIENSGDRKHMLDIMIDVCRDVTNKRGESNELMVPSTSHTLTKYFCLPARD